MFDNPYLIPIHLALIFMLIGMGIFLYWIYNPLRKVARQYTKLKRKVVKYARKAKKKENYRKNPDYQI
jgi:membrane protein insertase Oxa1/YidC/SpoIIIJ